MTEENPWKKRGEAVARQSTALAIPYLLMGGPLGGMAVGWLVGRWLGAENTGIIVGLILGLASAGVSTARILTRMARDEEAAKRAANKQQIPKAGSADSGRRPEE